MGRARRFVPMFLCVGALAFGVAAPVRAALFDDTEARQRIEATNQRLDQLRRQLDERMTSLETQIKNLGLVDLFNNVEQIRGDLAKLRGQLEVITYELSEAQKRQRDLYVDLDSRLRRLEAAGAANPPAAGIAPPAGAANVPPASAGPAGPPTATAGPATSAPPTSSPPFGPSPPGVSGSIPAPASRVPAGDPASEQRAYDASLDLFKAGNYSGAINGFSGFVKAYPRSALAPSAQYWIGNAQFALRDYRGSIASQRQLISSYPDSNKVPDAMLNIATSQFELGDMAGSRRTLEEIVKGYPQSDAAAKAKQRLAGR